MTPARTVCIVGAGPTGLTLARELHRTGHHPIVLEAADALGGKCASIDLDGRSYDLGGHICTPRYTALAQLASQLDVPTEQATPTLVPDPATRTWAPPDLSPLVNSDAHRRYTDLRAARFPDIASPGLSHSARALAAPVDQWLADNRLGPLAAALGTGYTAAGYGQLHSGVPALYFVKYAELTGLVADHPELMATAGAFTVAGGFGRLWQRIADTLPDLRLAARIRRIDRGGQGVTITTTGGVVEADDLILTVPLSRVLPVLDATPEEREIAAKVRHIDYRTLVFTAEDLPQSGFYLLPERTGSSSAAGRCVSFHHRHHDRDVYTGYVYGSPDFSEGRTADLLCEDMKQLGGRVRSVTLQRRWEFMPHFGSDDLRDGILDRLEDIQGQRRTYHAGSLPAFELIECTMGYAQDLARRFFPAPTAHTVAPQMTPTSRTTRLDEAELGAWLSTAIATELDIPPQDIDLDAPLYDYPFDSISFASLQAALSDLLGTHVASIDLVNQPTIGAIARHLTAGRNTMPAPRRSPLLLPMTTAHPLFCAGGAVGTVQYLRSLARELGPQHPFSALQAPGHDGSEEPYTDVEELAARYAEEIRQAQPRGPYLLGGHSFGGLVAYETGLHLQAAGEEIANVLVLDTYVPIPEQTPPPPDEAAAIEELATMNRIIDPAGTAERPALDTDASPERRREQLARLLGATGMLPDESFILAMLRIYQASLEAYVRYQPPPSDLPVTLFKATDGFPPVLRGDRHINLPLDDPHNGWNPRLLPNLTTVPIPGNHFTLLQQPHLTPLATAIRHSLTPTPPPVLRSGTDGQPAKKTAGPDRLR
ncbi:alpha/beta fold hydrolase [Amycolatopsis sp. QT-25]|uniref:thioesterase domain-containing protein n=1 Tax=Amycolatopsis sp. QT-25 TaxID=3034022 RepID=UPI0023EB2D6E|nr:alpha/beta fold hydrolase [Amycolatopsis sp. QT-25]WET82548.1 alpha/beta fold hydrolase [Amycolatopsis sp. QT-25]